MKAVIPVAGLGSRMLPMTKAISKEMLPIVDRPLIHHIINEAILAGIKDIVFVINPGQNLIKNYFGESPRLELNLEKLSKQDSLESIRSIVPTEVSLHYAYQEEARGLGDAILCARSCIGEAPFAVLLPDVLINQYQSNLSVDNLAHMVFRFKKQKISQVMVEQIPQSLVSKYGIVDCDNNELLSGETACILNLVEKPEKEHAPSNLAIVGRYVFSSNLWPFLEKTQKGLCGEIQLTDAIKKLSFQEALEAYHLVGSSHDCGDKAGYVLANIHYALEHTEISAIIRQQIRKQLMDAVQ